MTDMPLDSDDQELLAHSRPAAFTSIAEEVSEVFTHMLGDGRSVIDPATTIWTAEAAEDLRARVADNPIAGNAAGQWEKLDLQLEGAPREVVLLAAELVFLREHPIRNLTPEKRRSHVERVLAHVEPGVEIPRSVVDWLSRPTGTAGARVGQGYFGAMWRHIVWGATFVRYWTSLPTPEREAARTDPWELQRVMLASGEDEADFRNALQFLARPDTFELITAAEMKKRVRNGLAPRIGGGTGDSPDRVDRDLLAARLELARETEEPFNFWDPWVRALWDPSSTADDVEATPSAEPRERHYWMYSPGAKASKWGEFSSEGIMAIGWDELGDLAKYPNRKAIRHALDPEDSGRSMMNDVLAVWQFQNEIAVGDIVYAKRGRKELVGRGEVTSEARFEPERSSYRSVRSVEWTHMGSWEHPGDAVLKTLTDITKYPGYAEKLEALFMDDENVELPSVTTDPLPAYGKTDFLQEVYLPERRYDRLRSLLARKKNVILAGPPGVGKTFAAKRLAQSIMGVKDPSRIRVVQFHQSYSYEDFMMGYRPNEDGGFTLTEGPFYEFCEEARADDTDRPYFFIIDEINRGNISKIFGELLMLIEADKRGQDLRLLYKNERFSVPPNLHIIGMMNTADRSLAVLDYALRRRFGFFEMRPGFDSEGFSRWQRGVGSPALDSLVATLVELNRVIAEDPALGQGFAIGHSFLAGPSAGEDVQEWLESVVEDELIPLLDEYWFDEQARSAEWAEKLRTAVA
jgi:5-methylcytosine-specific restriction protein B